MKARPFLTTLIAVLTALLLLTAGLLWGMDRRSPLRLAEQPLQLPRAARFMPLDADLTLHWLVDPARVPAYVQAVAPPSERRAARDGARLWRDGLFALAGLDFDNELASWVGPELSLTMIDAGQNRDLPGWVLALSSRDRDGARRFLQRFWQTRSFAGTDLRVSSYRGVGVISGRGALLGRDPQPLATALIDDELLLLGSGRGVLETALDVSQFQDQHQLGNQQLQLQLGQLGEGAAVLTASPRALKRWLQLPAAVADRQDLNGLVASLQPQGADLNVEALLQFEAGLDGTPWREPVDLISDAGGRTVWLSLLQDPARLLDPEDPHPFSQWFGPLLDQQVQQRPATEAIAAADDGPLLWLEQAGGWLLASGSGHPEMTLVDQQLARDGLSRSELNDEGEPLQVWTRLERRRGRANGLEAKLALASVEESAQTWWGASLELLHQRLDRRALKPRLIQWQRLKADHQPSQALLLAADPAKQVMARWRPWTLLQALSGQPLQPRVNGLVLGVEADRQDGDQTVIPLHARLEFG